MLIKNNVKFATNQITCKNEAKTSHNKLIELTFNCIILLYRASHDDQDINEYAKKKYI